MLVFAALYTSTSPPPSFFSIFNTIPHLIPIPIFICHLPARAISRVMYQYQKPTSRQHAENRPQSRQTIEAIEPQEVTSP